MVASKMLMPKKKIKSPKKGNGYRCILSVNRIILRWILHSCHIQKFYSGRTANVVIAKILGWPCRSTVLRESLFFSGSRAGHRMIEWNWYAFDFYGILKNVNVISFFFLFFLNINLTLCQTVNNTPVGGLYWRRRRRRPIKSPKKSNGEIIQWPYGHHGYCKISGAAI